MATTHSSTRLDLTGQVFGRLTVLRYDGARGRSRHMWLCQCECGKEKSIRSDGLRGGGTQSCGCLCIERVKAKLTIHGDCASPTYAVWEKMKARCQNAKSNRYADYGGRGITVCERWQSFPNFLADMGERPSGMTIDRKDNDGHYEPGNCRWATGKEQSNNRRDNVHVTLSGITLTIAEWADRLGLGWHTIFYRLKRGATPKEALRPFTNKL